MPAATLWYCCQCDNGPMSIANNPACHQCNHRHGGCRYCKYVASSHRSRSSYTTEYSTPSYRPRSQYTAPASRSDDRQTFYSNSGSRYFYTPSSRVPTYRHEPQVIVRRPGPRYWTRNDGIGLRRTLLGKESLTNCFSLKIWEHRSWHIFSRLPSHDFSLAIQGFIIDSERSRLSGFMVLGFFLGYWHW